MNDRYTIDTPENIEFAYDIAGIGSRFLAALIDTLLIIIAEIIVFIVAGVLINLFGISTDTNAPFSVITALALLLAFGILWGYYIVFELVWNGQSPGKRAIGLRVVRDGGRPISFVGSAVRNLIRLIDLLPSFYGVGVIAMFADGRARRLGDLAAGTLVVKERRNVTLESLLAEREDPPAAADAPEMQLSLPNVERLREQDYQIVQEFLSRRAEFGRETRARLASQVASGIQGRLGLPQAGDAESFLQYVAAQYQMFQRQQTQV